MQGELATPCQKAGGMQVQSQPGVHSETSSQKRKSDRFQLVLEATLKPQRSHTLQRRQMVLITVMGVGIDQTQSCTCYTCYICVLFIGHTCIRIVFRFEQNEQTPYFKKCLGTQNIAHWFKHGARRNSCRACRNGDRKTSALLTRVEAIPRPGTSRTP